MNILFDCYAIDIQMENHLHCIVPNDEIDQDDHKFGPSQLGVVQMGVVQLGVVQLGVVQMGVDPDLGYPPPDLPFKTTVQQGFIKEPIKYLERWSG